MNKQNIEQLKKEFKMVLDDAFEDKSYLSDKPQMNEEDALFEQVLDVVWNFFLPHLISSDEIKREVKEEIKRQLEMTVMLADQNTQNGNYVDWVALLNSFIKHNLTQSKEGGE